MAMGVHLGEGALVGIATAAAVKKGNVAARYLLPKSVHPKSRSYRTIVCGVNATAGLTATALTCYGLTTETDKQALTSRIVHAPLMPLMSPTSDLFCDRIIDACSSGDDNISTNMKQFAENCKLRRDYETKLRKQQGLSADEPIEIPFMGVPTKATPDDSVIAIKAKYLNASDLGCSADYPDDDEEALLEFNDVIRYLKEMSVIGTVTFLLLRKIPHRLVTRIQPYLTSILNKHRYRIDPPPLAKQHVLIRVPTMGFQVCASFIIALYGVFFREYHSGRLPRHIIESPLVSGRSSIADHCCSDIVNEYKDRQQSFAKSDDPSLRNLSALIHNCQRRQEREQWVRDVKGLSKDTTVSIPLPGVLHGITRDEVDKAWAESLVTDREMNDNNSAKNAQQPNE